jgi:ferredoxin
MAEKIKPEQMAQITHRPPLFKGWMDSPVEIKSGVFCYAGKPQNLKYLDLPNPREWSPADEDWKLPSNWKEIVLEGLRERLERFRSLKIFMDICVRCGACADKCHFFRRRGPRNTVLRSRAFEISLGIHQGRKDPEGSPVQETWISTCSRSGGLTFSSAASAGAAPSSAPTALTQRRSRSLPGNFLTSWVSIPTGSPRLLQTATEQETTGKS